jgi:hypothetical protein
MQITEMEEKMKGLSVVVILLLIIAVIVAIALPKREKAILSLQREAPLPQAKMETKTEEKTPVAEIAHEPVISETPKTESVSKGMKVNFYALNDERGEKGELLGFAQLKDGKLDIEVSDAKLKEILEKPYSSMSGEVKEGVATDSLITYESGTFEHLETIAVECWQFGYVGEIE